MKVALQDAIHHEEPRIRFSIVLYKSWTRSSTSLDYHFSSLLPLPGSAQQCQGRGRLLSRRTSTKCRCDQYHLQSVVIITTPSSSLSSSGDVQRLLLRGLRRLPWQLHHRRGREHLPWLFHAGEPLSNQLPLANIIWESETSRFLLRSQVSHLATTTRGSWRPCETRGTWRRWQTGLDQIIDVFEPSPHSHHCSLTIWADELWSGQRLVGSPARTKYYTILKYYYII